MRTQFSPSFFTCMRNVIHQLNFSYFYHQERFLLDHVWSVRIAHIEWECRNLPSLATDGVCPDLTSTLYFWDFFSVETTCKWHDQSQKIFWHLFFSPNPKTISCSVLADPSGPFYLLVFSRSAWNFSTLFRPLSSWSMDSDLVERAGRKQRDRAGEKYIKEEYLENR